MTDGYSQYRSTTARVAVLISFAAALFVSAGARGEDAKPDKSGYTLFNPTPESALRDFAPDRPAKSTGPTTVDAGHVLLEVELLNYSRQKTDTTRTDTWVGPNPTARIGITNRFEVQLNWAPYLHQRNKDLTTGDVTGGDGPSDLFVRGKLNIWGNEGGKTALALIPYIKAGTAPESVGGNRATEGGVIVPFSVSLPNSVSLLFNTELDRLKNSTGGGYHDQYVNTVGLTAAIAKDVSLTGELWSQINVEPSGTVRQFSFDTALAWTVQPNLQLDVGANFGLNKDTPALQIYTGIARRF
jgi:Putative MetA-pathway of phenol degradation